MAQKVTPSTQQFVEVKEIGNGIVHLKSGGLRRVLAVGGVNFDLKSEEEQGAILGSFQHFLNTLDFMVQFFVHSRKVNVDAYLKKIRDRKLEETNELLKIQIDDYADFVQTFVSENPIITKTFFAVVPYDPFILPQRAEGALGFLRRGGKKPAAGEAHMELEKQVFQLSQRVDEVAAGLEAAGLSVRALQDEELLELFYNLYNPQTVEKRGLEILKKAT